MVFEKKEEKKMIERRTEKERMNVLIACEESQTVCKAFRERGHAAFSCDIQECSGGHPEWHIMRDVLEVLNPHFYESDLSYGIHFSTMDGTPRFVKKWDMIIGHPPCTYMSKASARHMYPSAGVIDLNRLLKAERAKNFFLEIYNANCDKICVENPTPLKVVNLPIPTQIIQPYQFGHPFSKRTLLWIKGLPQLIPTKIVEVYKPYIPSNTSLFAKGKGGSYGVSGSKIRSKTFAGIATAMAEQWG